MGKRAGGRNAVSTATTVLAVDQNPRNLELLVQILGSAGYQVRTAGSLEEFDDGLAAIGEIGLTLIDLTGFDSHIWERCEKLRAREVPFLILSTRHSTALQQASLAHGAQRVVVKPLAIRELLALMHGYGRSNK